MDRSELLQYARLGAQARMNALQQEMDGLRRRFPGLTANSGQQKGRAAKGAAATASDSGAPVTRNMSAAARKRISDAAKKRWVEWRKKNKKD